LGIVLVVYVFAIGVNALILIGTHFWVNSIFNGLALIIAIALARSHLKLGWHEQPIESDNDTNQLINADKKN